MNWWSDTLDISPADAARLSLNDGDLVEVTSRRGSIVLPARVTTEIAPGEVFTAFHSPAPPATNSPHTDTITGCPEYKVTTVTLHPVQPSPAQNSAGHHP